MFRDRLVLVSAVSGDENTTIILEFLIVKENLAMWTIITLQLFVNWCISKLNPKWFFIIFLLDESVQYFANIRNCCFSKHEWKLFIIPKFITKYTFLKNPSCNNVDMNFIRILSLRKNIKKEKASIVSSSTTD